MLPLSGCHLVVCSRFGRVPFRRRTAALWLFAERLKLSQFAGRPVLLLSVAAPPPPSPLLSGRLWLLTFTEWLLLSAVWPLLLLTSAGRLWLSPSSVRCRRRRGRPRLLLGSCCGGSTWRQYRLCVAAAATSVSRAVLPAVVRRLSAAVAAAAVPVVAAGRLSLLVESPSAERSRAAARLPSPARASRAAAITVPVNQPV